MHYFRKENACAAVGIQNKLLFDRLFLYVTDLQRIRNEIFEKELYTRRICYGIWPPSKITVWSIDQFPTGS
jgi:hypothetical protein